MKEEKNYKVAFFTLLGFILGGLVVGGIFYFAQDNKKENTDSNRETKTNHELKIKEEKNDKKSNKDSNENTNTKSNKINKELSKEDSVVLEYLEDKYEKISENVTKENAKGIFIEIVDFLFYDGEIKGYTLSDLTNKGKIEVANLCAKIEMKIEEKHPGAIDETEKKYRDKKENIIIKLKDYIDSYCTDNSDTCEKVKSSYETIKKSFEKLKEYGSKGVEKVSKWYSNFKNSN